MGANEAAALNGTARDAHARLLAQPPGADYPRHALHGERASWAEKNCYIDVWVEVLHALGLEPMAALPFTLAIDFVDDQWTFYKPPHDELWDGYGIDVQELTPWRPLQDLAVEHLSRGRMIATEADAWWLPDTAGTDYRRNHVKTTIVLVAIDPAAQWATYFHNTGLHRMDGEDYRRTFGLEGERHDGAMPLFAELVRIDRLVSRTPAELRAWSLRCLARHLARRPLDNPVTRFAARLAQDAPALAQGGLAHFHAWAFVTLRQLGSAFELSAAHLRWQAAQADGAAQRTAFESAAAAFERIDAGAKTMILKGARSANSKRPMDASALLADMAAAWDEGMALLDGTIRG